MRSCFRTGTVLSGLLLFAALSAQAQEDNQPPVVGLVGATPFADQSATISYVLFDAEDDVQGNLRYELYLYPDGRSIRRKRCAPSAG